MKAALLIACGFLTAAFAGESRKIVIIAGALDAGHPKGTHEYEKSARLLKHCLDHSPNLKGVKTEVHFNGWPKDPATLDDAATIVLTSNGSDRDEKSHPLLVDNRLPVLEKQMKRGCGFAAIHWTTFVPTKRAGAQYLEWIGGYFDYESGTNHPQKWFSRIKTAKTTARPGTADHALCRGLKPFELEEEYYYNIRFRENDTRLIPVLVTPIPGEAKDQTVAWAVERADGGRGFGFTGGHFFKNWQVDNFRKMVLNAIVWSAKAEIPADGVESKCPTEEELGKADPIRMNSPNPDPRHFEGWQEAQAVDNRFQAMVDLSGALTATINASDKITMKALCFRIGPKVESTVCFDTELLRYSAISSEWIKIDPIRYGLIGIPKLKADPLAKAPDGCGWNANGTFNDTRQRHIGSLPREVGHYTGYYLLGDRVVLSYTVNGTAVLESPWLEVIEGKQLFGRAIEISPMKNTMHLFVANLAGATKVTSIGQGVSVLMNGTNLNYIFVTDVPAAQWNQTDGKLSVEIPKTNESHFIQVLHCRCDPNDAPGLDRPIENLREMIALKKWPAQSLESFTTKGILDKSDQPFLIDTLTMPYDNSDKALMFASGIDFFKEGDAAICTAHGDVWRVSGIDEKLEKLSWRRIASGLFQPLGLKIVDNVVYVTGRDQITKLVDLNGDGETDFYENFNNDGEVTANGHEYVTNLETDAAGNFYFLKGDSGGSSAHDGCLLKVSKDGKNLSVFATGLRNANGLGIGPNDLITASPQEGHWTPNSSIIAIKEGGFYGNTPSHHRKTAPTTFDPPLCWIPRTIDNSSGSQVWIDSDKWGPLKGKLLHFSYGRCSMMLVPHEKVGEQYQGGVVPLPGRFSSGVMRGRFNPKDNELYVVGLRGWVTAAIKDGCVQRVRFNNKGTYPIGLNIVPQGVRITFTNPIDKKSAEDVDGYAVEQWNYHWGSHYGSDDFSVANPGQLGRDTVSVTGAELSADGKSVLLKIPSIQPVMQMKIKMDVRAADGSPVKHEIYNTINAVPAK